MLGDAGVEFCRGGTPDEAGVGGNQHRRPRLHRDRLPVDLIDRAARQADQKIMDAVGLVDAPRRRVQHLDR